MNVSNDPTTTLTPRGDDGFKLQANAKPEQVAAAFESVFATMLIKQMRSTLSDGFFGGEQSDILGGLFDQHIGKAMAENGSLGIRDLVLRQLEQHPATKGAINRYAETNNGDVNS